MSIWANSRMETFYGSEDTLETDRCAVTIEDGRIKVTYDYDGGQSNPDVEVYNGIEMAPGHFNLASEDGLGKASLHRFPDGLILEGWWHETEDEGMWRIFLHE
jgi:hypothetical protein